MEESAKGNLSVAPHPQTLQWQCWVSADKATCRCAELGNGGGLALSILMMIVGQSGPVCASPALAGDKSKVSFLGREDFQTFNHITL